MSRYVVSVGTGNHGGKLVRLRSQLIQQHENYALWDVLPVGSLPHEQAPYAFKIYALEQAHREIVDTSVTLLWLDSAVMILRPLGPIWRRIERHGYWFSQNHDYNCGEWTCDSALPILGITREEAFTIPQIVGGCFGLNMRAPVAQEFMERWKEYALAGAFAGPWRNDHGEASLDPRVQGHRHDQTAASVIVHRMGLRLTQPPRYFSDDGFPATEETILTARRC